MTKQPRKVSLINVADYPRDKYSAYWIISVEGDAVEGYRWQANILAYAPIGWSHEGKVTAKRPDHAFPIYPPDIAVSQQQYVDMDAAAQGRVRFAQDARRATCAQIYEAHPKPVHGLAEQIGVADTRDEADTAAQEWVIKQMKKYRRPASGTLSSFAFAHPLALDFLLDFLRWLARPLLTLGYSTTVRNNRMISVRDAIDGGAGAGLLRIYDGSRPATCGAATTLLAELTHTDPCAGAPASGVLTFSAITADSSANATGTATWYRDVDSTGTCCVDGSVGTSGSDLNLNSTSIATGQQVSVTSKVYTGGNP